MDLETSPGKTENIEVKYASEKTWIKNNLEAVNALTEDRHWPAKVTPAVPTDSRRILVARMPV